MDAGHPVYIGEKGMKDLGILKETQRMNLNQNKKKMNLSLAVLVMLTISMSTSMKTESTSEVHDKLVIDEPSTTYLRNGEISQSEYSCWSLA